MDRHKQDMHQLLTRLLFCHCRFHKCSTHFSAWSFSVTMHVSSMTVITLGMSMKFLTSLAIKAILETKPTMSRSKSFRFNWERLPVCWVWNSSSRKWDFWLELCDGISCHGMLWQLLWTAMFKDSIVKIEKWKLWTGNNSPVVKRCPKICTLVL